MKTHELADLLANVVLLLRRLSDAECKQLQRAAEVEKLSVEAEQSPGSSPAPLPKKASGKRREELPTEAQQTLRSSSAPFSQEELKKKSVPELKMLADELHIVYNTRILKEELVNRILARKATGHSEQYAIQNL